MRNDINGNKAIFELLQLLKIHQTKSMVFDVGDEKYMLEKVGVGKK